MRLHALALATVVAISAAAAARAENATVLQEGKRFSETEVTVKQGESVTFVNKDAVTHNVFSITPDMSFDLHQQKAGESSTIAFDKVGEATVQCAIHPIMKMKVIVR